MSIIGKSLSLLLAGAVLGILFAPDKGIKTRKKISKKAKDLKDQLSGTIEEGKSVLSDLKKTVTNVTNIMNGSDAKIRGNHSHSRRSHTTAHSSN